MESSADGDEKEDTMKKNKKLNSIATMSKKELQEVNGGNMYYILKHYPRILVEGKPNPIWDQGVHEMNAGMMNQAMIR